MAHILHIESDLETLSKGKDGLSKTIQNTRKQYNTMYVFILQEIKSNNMLKKDVEEMKEIMIKLKQDLHNLLAVNGSTVAMASDVTNVLTVNYFAKTPMSNDTGVSKVIFEEVWIMFHPSLFFVIKGLYVTTTCIVLKRIVMHLTFFGLHS